MGWIVCDCHARAKVLAAMRKCITNRVLNRARSKVSRYIYSSSGVRRDASGEFLSLADSTLHRHFQPSETSTIARQRSVLANLISLIDPVMCEIVADNLISEFGSIGKVFQETHASLTRIIGHNSAIVDLLLSANAALVEGLLSDVPHRIVSSTNQHLIDYLVATMGSRSNEILRIMFLDRSDHLIADEILATGSTQSLTVYPRTIFRRAFELSSTSILIVHNHPGGNIEPSRADIDFTKRLKSLGEPLEIYIKDHIIIAGTRWYSFSRQAHL